MHTGVFGAVLLYPLPTILASPTLIALLNRCAGIVVVIKDSVIPSGTVI
jgi:hypothetical protein